MVSAQLDAETINKFPNLPQSLGFLKNRTSIFPKIEVKNEIVKYPSLEYQKDFLLKAIHLKT